MLRLRTPHYVLLLLALPLAYLLVTHIHDVRDTLSYSTRPLWDAPEVPARLLPHLQAAGVADDDAAACARHGWALRPQRARVVDATLLSTEIEMLEIRLAELDEHVDLFVVVESDHTLMGAPKVSAEWAAVLGGGRPSR
jgi:beta-1,4-mannosyl-glycoprotein beta-1,4-N-acetylglucosaminyltransferase